MNEPQEPSTSGFSREKPMTSNESDTDSDDSKINIPESLREDISSDNEADQEIMKDLKRRIKHPHRLPKRHNKPSKRPIISSDGELDRYERLQSIKLLHRESHLQKNKQLTLKNIG